MANYLKMAQVQAILQLKKGGWSNRRIERELGIHRETVRSGRGWFGTRAKFPPPQY